MKTGTAQNETQRAEKLHELLLAIAGGLEKLYGCLRDQQSSLLRWNLPGFTAAMDCQQELVRENMRRELQRKALVCEIVGEERSATATLSQIAQELGGDWPECFQDLARRIRTASGKVAEMKKQNESLIGHGQRLVNDQIKLLLDLARLNRNLYEHSGRKSSRSNLHKVLDQKA